MLVVYLTKFYIWVTSSFSIKEKNYSKPKTKKYVVVLILILGIFCVLLGT